MRQGRQDANHLSWSLLGPVDHNTDEFLRKITPTATATAASIAPESTGARITFRSSLHSFVHTQSVFRANGIHTIDATHPTTSEQTTKH